MSAWTDLSDRLNARVCITAANIGFGSEFDLLLPVQSLNIRPGHINHLDESAGCSLCGPSRPQTL